MHAAFLGESKTAALLIASRADLEATDELVASLASMAELSQDGSNALILAAEQGHADLVKQLIQAGADIHAEDQVSLPLPLIQSITGNRIYGHRSDMPRSFESMQW